MACLFLICFCELDYTLSESVRLLPVMRSSRYHSLNTPPETVPLDRTNGAAKPLKWCMVTAAIVH